jgi:hypothetical protein
VYHWDRPYPGSSHARTRGLSRGSVESCRGPGLPRASPRLKPGRDPQLAGRDGGRRGVPRRPLSSISGRRCLTCLAWRAILPSHSIPRAEVAFSPDAKATKGKPVTDDRESGAVPQLYAWWCVSRRAPLGEPGYPPLPGAGPTFAERRWRLTFVSRPSLCAGKAFCSDDSRAGRG